MKSKIIFYLISVIFLANSCTKEQTPAGLILVDAVVDKDTSYNILPVPAPQLKKIFVEEFTGVRCQGCPYGSAVLKNIEIANPNRIVVAKAHSDFQSQPYSGFPDLRCADAQTLDDVINKGSPKPCASINRIYNATNVNNTYNYNYWNSLTASELAKPTPINLDISVLNFDAVTSTVKLKTTATFTSTVTDSLTYHIYIVEDKIVAKQDSGGVLLLDYEHEAVLRDIITPIAGGQPWLDAFASKNAGLQAIKISTFQLPSSILDKAKVKIIFAVQGGQSKQIIHVQEVSLQ